MDPITIFAAVSTAFNGVKKAVELGREAQDIFGQLGKWAKAAGDLQDFIHKEEKKAGGSFENNDSQQALQIIAAKSKLAQMEEEIRHMFVYGELQHLGMIGYRDFVLLRRKIREDREKAEKEKIRKKYELMEKIFWYSILAAVLFIAGIFSYVIYGIGASTGRW